jgi:hypothetical protein
MKRLSVLFALTVLFTWVLPVSAGSQGNQCPRGDAIKALLYENSINDLSDNDDRLWFCDGKINLAATSHTLPGDCNVAYDFDMTTWGACASSVAAWLPPGYRMCMDWWTAKVHHVLQIIGPKSGQRYDIPDDVITSAWFTSGRCV